MHQFKLQRSTIAVGLACAAVLTLSGCAATSITGSTAVPAAEASAKKMKAEPVKISMPVVDAFRGSGIFFFDDNVRSRLYISDTIAVMDDCRSRKKRLAALPKASPGELVPQPFSATESRSL